MPFECPVVDKSNNGKNLFEYRCGTDVFKRFYKEWDPDFKNYLNHINEINDPILRHISMYFVQHYIDGHHYYRESDPTHRNAACQYIIHWLQEKKDLFTYGEKCKTKKELWKTNFDALLTMLKSKYIIKEYKITKPWCNDFELVELTSFDPGVTLNNCEENISQVSSSPCPSTLPNITNCECPQTAFPVIPSLPDQPSEKDPTKNIAVTSGFTAAGTLGTLFFLYRFTPMMSWFRRPGMNNIGTDLYMDPGAPDGFLSMQHGNGNNNIFYQP